MRRMARRDADGWRISSWKREAKAILQLAMQQKGTTRQIAESLIDFLGRQGFIEFGQLLETESQKA